MIAGETNNKDKQRERERREGRRGELADVVATKSGPDERLFWTKRINI